MGGIACVFHGYGRFLSINAQHHFGHTKRPQTQNGQNQRRARPKNRDAESAPTVGGAHRTRQLAYPKTDCGSSPNFVFP